MGVGPGEETEKGLPSLREARKHVKRVGSETEAGEDRRKGPGRRERDTPRPETCLQQPKPFVTGEKCLFPRQSTVGWTSLKQSWGTGTEGSARGSPGSPQQWDPVLPGLINKQACGKCTFFLQEMYFMFTASFFFFSFLKQTLPCGAPGPDSVPECPRPWPRPPVIAWVGKIRPWESQSATPLLTPLWLSLVTEERHTVLVPCPTPCQPR